MDEHHFEELLADEHKPLDDAVALMAQGYDLHTLEGHQPMFDPYYD